MTVDHWVDEAAYPGTIAEFAAEFEALDQTCARAHATRGAPGRLRVVGVPPHAGRCVVPILRVRSLKDSLRYYVEVLGFQVEWGGEEGSAMASVGRDGCSIMLCEGAQGQPGTWVWIGVEDVSRSTISCRDAERSSVRNRRTDPGPTRCKWKPDRARAGSGSEPLPEARSSREGRSSRAAVRLPCGLGEVASRSSSRSPGVWIELAKKDSGVDSVSRADALEVALCYGLDRQSVDDRGREALSPTLTPRRSRSKSSKINCAAVERLHAEGRLARAGVREMEAAKGDGRWEAA